MVDAEQEKLVALVRDNPGIRIIPMVRHKDDEYCVLQIDRAEVLDLAEGKNRIWDRTDDIGQMLNDTGEAPRWEKCIAVFLNE